MKSLFVGTLKCKLYSLNTNFHKNFIDFPQIIDIYSLWYVFPLLLFTTHEHDQGMNELNLWGKLRTHSTEMWNRNQHTRRFNDCQLERQLLKWQRATFENVTVWKFTQIFDFLVKHPPKSIHMLHDASHWAWEWKWTCFWRDLSVK